MKWNYVTILCVLLSIIAISLSGSAIAIANARVGEVEHDPSGFYGWACAFLGVIITILMAWQIFNTISIDSKIQRNINEAQKQSDKKIMNEHYANHYKLLKILWNDFKDAQKWNLLLDTHINMMDLSAKLEDREIANDILNKCDILKEYSIHMNKEQIKKLRIIGSKIGEVSLYEKRFASELSKKYKNISIPSDNIETSDSRISVK